MAVKISIAKPLMAILFVVHCVNLGQSLPTADGPPMPGGFASNDVKDDKYLKLASNGISKVDTLKGEQCQRQIRNVIESKSQVVAGTRYLMKVEMCSPEMCNGKQQAPVCSICTLDLWEKPWENFLQVTDLKCPSQEKWNYST